MLENTDAYGARDKRRFTDDLTNTQSLIAETQKLIAEKTAQRDLHEELAKKAADEGWASLDAIKKTQAAEKDRLDQLKETAKTLQQIRSIQDASAAAAQWKALQDAKEKAHQSALAGQEAGQALVDQAKPEADQQRARAGMMAEMVALRLQASGRAAAADALRKEFQLRSDAAQLAKAANLSEAQALNFLREKARLQESINRNGDNEHRRHRRRIYKKTAGDPRLTRDNMGEGYTGLRNFEIHRRNTTRSNRPATPNDDAAKNLLKSVNIQEEMLKIWQKLNVV